MFLLYWRIESFECWSPVRGKAGPSPVTEDRKAAEVADAANRSSRSSRKYKSSLNRGARSASTRQKKKKIKNEKEEAVEKQLITENLFLLRKLIDFWENYGMDKCFHFDIFIVWYSHLFWFWFTFLPLSLWALPFQDLSNDLSTEYLMLPNHSSTRTQYQNPSRLVNRKNLTRQGGALQ